MAVSGKLCALLKSLLPSAFLVSSAIVKRASDAINIGHTWSIILNKASTQAVFLALQHECPRVLDICSAMQHLLDVSGCISRSTAVANQLQPGGTKAHQLCSG